MEKDSELLTLLKQVELIQEGKGQSLGLKTARLMRTLFKKPSSKQPTELKETFQPKE